MTRGAVGAGPEVWLGESPFLAEGGAAGEMGDLVDVVPEFETDRVGAEGATLRL